MFASGKKKIPISHKLKELIRDVACQAYPGDEEMIQQKGGELLDWIVSFFSFLPAREVTESRHSFDKLRELAIKKDFFIPMMEELLTWLRNVTMYDPVDIKRLGFIVNPVMTIDEKQLKDLLSKESAAALDVIYQGQINV